MTAHHNYLVILAGGSGRRLWPVSRHYQPKQFLDIFGTGQTLLQQTYARFAPYIDSEYIYVSTYEEYVDEVLRQLPDIRPEHVLSEPVQLSTAPSAAWATLHIEQFDPEANIIVTPADHMITNIDTFKRDVEDGLAYVEKHPDFLALAAHATLPNTAYGYIQKGERVSEETARYRVKSFSEKPNLEFAQMFVESGEFVWNTGLFMWSVPTMIKQLQTLIPDVVAQWHTHSPMAFEEEQALIREAYPATLRLSVDLLILVKSDANVCVQECDFGWADIGSWQGVYDIAPRDADGNVLLSGNTLLSDSSGNVVNLPADHLVCIRGLKDYIVAERDKVLVICPRDNADALRQFLNEAQVRINTDFV